MGTPQHDRAEAIYRQILDQLEELWLVWNDQNDAGDDDEEESGPVIGERDLVGEMTEEATARGIDEDSAERVFKAVEALAKKAQEG